jgi:hypothetical protein
MSFGVGEFAGCQGAVGVGESSWFGDLVCRGGRWGDESVGDGSGEECSGGGDDVFAGVASAVAVAAGYRVGVGFAVQRLDVGGGDGVG